MDELTRFARLLVERLATRPEGVQRPVSVGDIRKNVLAYRSQRRALGLDSVEDYETVLLRLIAEERGYVKTLPASAAARCREELGQPNPDLGVLEDVATATLQVTSLAAGKVVDNGDEAPAAEAPPSPPPPAPKPAPREPVAAAPSPPSSPSTPTSPSMSECRFCHKALPTGRTVTFCAWCGERLIPLTCGRCGSEVESAWRHCVTCGLPVQDPYRAS